MADLTIRLQGKRVAAAFTNGHVLSLRMETGEEVNIVWLNDNGVPIKGKPAVQASGARLIARGMQDLIRAPQH